eukprot:s8480_g2.t1
MFCQMFCLSVLPSVLPIVVPTPRRLKAQRDSGIEDDEAATTGALTVAAAPDALTVLTVAAALMCPSESLQAPAPRRLRCFFRRLRLELFGGLKVRRRPLGVLLRSCCGAIREAEARLRFGRPESVHCCLLQAGRLGVPAPAKTAWRPCGGILPLRSMGFRIASSAIF